MKDFEVGDEVIRNNVVALYSEDIFPVDMEFDHVYTVRAIHTKNVPTIPTAKFTVAELDVGEINIDLLDKIERS